MYSIMAIKVDERGAKAPYLQEILTENGCIIKTRVGFHETDEDKCSREGIILLHLYGEKKEFDTLHDKVNNLDGVIAKFVEF